MQPEPWFKKDLRLIDRHFQILRFPRFKKWFIVRPAPCMLAGVTEYHPHTAKHYYVDWVLEDRYHNPLILTLGLQYEIVKELRRMKHQREAIKVEELDRQMDASDGKKIRDRNREFFDRIWKMRQAIHRLRTTKTFS